MCKKQTGETVCHLATPRNPVQKKLFTQTQPLNDNLQIQHDNLVQEAQEVPEAQAVPLVQADRPIQAVLEVLLNHGLLERPVGQKSKN